MKNRPFAGRLVIPLAPLLLALWWNPEAVPPAPPPVDSISLEELMNLPLYGASKYEQKVTDAPSSVSIVTSRDIVKYGYRTMADIIRAQREFYVNYDRNYHYIGIRGFLRPGDYNLRILLLIDGPPTHEAADDSVC